MLIFRFAAAPAWSGRALRRGLLAAVILGCVSRAAEPVATNPAAPPAWYRPELALVMTNFARAQQAAEERLAAARTARDETAEAYALLVLGAARGRQSDLITGARHTATGLAIAERLGNPELLLAARRVHAASLRANDDLPAAIDLYFKNLGEAERLGDRAMRQETLFGLALCYSALGDADREREFARRAVVEAEFLDAPDALAASEAVLDQNYFNRGENAEARRHLLIALGLRQKLGNRTNIADVEELVAMLDFREGRSVEALATLEQVVAQRRTLRGRTKLANVLVHQATVLQKLGRLDEALKVIEEARGYADGIDSQALAFTVYRTLSEVRERRGEQAEALTALRRSFAAEAKVNGDASRRRVEELQTRFEVAKKDADITRLARANEVNAAELRAREAELSRARTVRFTLIGGALAGAVALGAIVFALRTRLRAERMRSEETQRARAAAEEANALKSKLLGIASHDLKAPLRAMLARAAQLAPAVEASPGGATALAHLRGDGERMLGLVRDLLDVSAIETGELRLALAPVELGALTAEVVRALLAPAELKALALTCAVPPAPAWVRGDRERLRDVLTNLVDNAVKFSPPGKAIAVSVAVGASDVVVSVRDEGPGLTPEDFARLFQPFETLSAVPTAGESSTGLGLHIAREIIARHGGRLDVDSLPGVATTFALVLPAQPAA